MDKVQHDSFIEIIYTCLMRHDEELFDCLFLMHVSLFFHFFLTWFSYTQYPWKIYKYIVYKYSMYMSGNDRSKDLAFLFEK
jgi:hypothetical protein